MSSPISFHHLTGKTRKNDWKNLLRPARYGALGMSAINDPALALDSRAEGPRRQSGAVHNQQLHDLADATI